MKFAIRKVRKEQFEWAMTLLNAKYGGNIGFHKYGKPRFHDPSKYHDKREAEYKEKGYPSWYRKPKRGELDSEINFTFALLDKKGPGGKRSAVTGNKLQAISLEVARDFLEILFRLEPNARVRLKPFDIQGKADFDAAFRNSKEDKKDDME